MRTFKQHALVVLFILTGSGLTHAEESPVFRTPQEKLNYAIGVEIARNYKTQGIDLDLDLVTRGLRDGVTGGKLLLPEKELRNILIAVQSDLRRKRSAAKRNATLAKPGKGLEFTAEEKEKPGESHQENLPR